MTNKNKTNTTFPIFLLGLAMVLISNEVKAISKSSKSFNFFFNYPLSSPSLDIISSQSQSQFYYESIIKGYHVNNKLNVVKTPGLKTQLFFKVGKNKNLKNLRIGSSLYINLKSKTKEQGHKDGKINPAIAFHLLMGGVFEINKIHFFPYVGLGLGYLRHERLNTFSTSTSTSYDYDQSGLGPAYEFGLNFYIGQFVFGPSFQIIKAKSRDISYRTEKLKLKSSLLNVGFSF